MKNKIRLSMVIAVLMILSFTFNISALEDECEWCNYWIDLETGDACYEGCLVPPTNLPDQGIVFRVWIINMVTQEVRRSWVLCVLENDETCDEPCKHYTARYPYSSLGEDEEFTGNWTVFNLLGGDRCDNDNPYTG